MVLCMGRPFGWCAPARRLIVKLALLGPPTPPTAAAPLPPPLPLVPPPPIVVNPGALPLRSSRLMAARRRDMGRERLVPLWLRGMRLAVTMR